MRSGPGVARTILLFHIISARPSKQPLRVRTFLKVYMELGSYFFVSARTNKRHHHHSKLQEAWDSSEQKDECIVRLNDLEGAYWMGTEKLR